MTPRGHFVILMSIDMMLVRPGRYEVASEAMRAHGASLAVEVDEEGRCFQLNKAGERDGELARDGWSSDARAVLFTKPLP